ncbi:glycosyltransferase family 4 protein [Halorubrum sp. Eb13]|uniref:glycosyltransferase family 4 protein n=1 Tax=Halorubrum sp. Eb13 TaxID=1383843 RepID=UPI000B9833A6|nr:glycosyltransferase family 4 protein [Halorubrum sp. Eb13]OYR41425.1 glycosyltransferase WbuB [Halorubrum sp. Eb13]
MSDQNAQRVVVASQHYPPDKSGNASRVSDTCSRLAAEGWEVTVLAPPPAFPHGQFDRSWDRKTTDTRDGVTVHRLWAWQPTLEDPGFISRMAYYLLFPIHAFLWLLFNYRTYDAVITSSPPIFTGMAALPFGLLSRKSWIVDVRDLWIDASVGLGFIEEGGVLERVSRAYERVVLRTADRVTVTTTVLGERLESQYGIDDRKIVHLPNGVETAEFRPTDGKSASTIVYTGNVGHAQDLEACIKALSEMDSDTATLRIVGDGDIRNDLDELVSEEGLDDRVEFTGLVPREEIPGILDNAAIGVAPLKSDDVLEYAIPTKAYEYMAFRLPVVATGIGEIEVLIDESEGGVFVENDPQRLAEAFDTLLADPERREQLGRNGREHVVERYDRGVIAARLSAVLDEVVIS